MLLPISSFPLHIENRPKESLSASSAISIRTADGKSVMLDFREVAPSGATADMFVGKPGLRCAFSLEPTMWIVLLQQLCFGGWHSFMAAQLAAWLWLSPGSSLAWNLLGAITAPETYLSQDAHPHHPH